MMFNHNISDEYPHFHLPVLNDENEALVVMNGHEVVAIKFLDNILVYPDLRPQNDEMPKS